MVTPIGMTAKAGQAFTYGMGIKMAAQYTTGAVTSYGVSYFGEKLGLSKTGVTMLNLGVGYLEGCAWNKGEMYLRSRKSNSHVDVNTEEPIFDKELSANAEKARTDLDIRTKAAQENSKVLGNGSGSVPDIGYNSFKDLKADLGSPGEGNAWHHIVEQSQIGKSGFGSKQVNNVNNVISIPHGKGTMHAKISGYYSSKQFFTGGKIVRQWLAGQSFEEQFEFGMNLLKEYGDVTPTKNGWIFTPFE